MQRIAKLIARSGLCSRREAERWVDAGRVTVQGKVIRDPATMAEEADITVDGKPLVAPAASRLWLFNKPREVMTTRSDPEGRMTYVDLLPDELKNLHPVGRLDYQSEGLLLLTNDGALKRSLELPSQGWERVYRVRYRNEFTAPEIAKLLAGVTVEEVNYRPIKIVPENTKATNPWAEVTLQEGKNREIRRVFQAFGHPVSRLIRLRYGPFALGKLETGKLSEIAPEKWHKALEGKA